MRITSTGAAARAAFYDRNPLEITALGFSGANTAPHGGTTRGTYTVPTARKAQIMFVSKDMSRSAVAAPVGAALFRTVLGFASGTGALQLEGNVVGSAAHGESGMGSVLLAGKTTSMQTADGSTGGTIDYDGLTDILEFDA